MDRLADELILNILSYLDLLDLVRFQQTCRQFLPLGRDSNAWKTRCFTDSRAEIRRRRQELYAAQDARMVALRDAVGRLSGRTPDSHQSATEWQGSSTTRIRAMASWEPTYPGEAVDFYEEYIHRHAPIAPIGWLDLPSRRSVKSHTAHEATGMGVIRDNSTQEIRSVIAPLDDGSICLWDMTNQSTRGVSRRGQIAARSSPGLLSGCDSNVETTKVLDESRTIMTETGAVECVSIDNRRSRGLFAVQNQLHEIDLTTLQSVSCEVYPFPILALSSADSEQPVTVGTASTVHMYDPRNKTSTKTQDDSVRLELIGGSSASHAILTQPGPLSILHHCGGHADDHSIWVAGRFTHLLNYDRRYFPRLRETLYSGARISSIAALPFPHIPRQLDLVQNPDASPSDLQTAKLAPGSTLLAAGVYKGKGSLELYGLSDTRTPTPTSVTGTTSTSAYQNRQTASSSKLLSAAYHGAAIVFSDGDGNLKWVERDGSSAIRSYNINDDQGEPPSFNQAQTRAQQQQQQQQRDNGDADDSAAYGGIFSTSAAELPGQGDIVQKILPTDACSSLSSSSSLGQGRSDANSGNLLLWTGDGRIGLLGFGHAEPLAREELIVEAKNAQERALEDAERQYSGTLRRALEGQANEARFMRGLGLGYQQHW